MIFDKEYDKLLWLTLVVDNKNREEIINLIRKISDIYGMEQVQELIRLYRIDNVLAADCYQEYVLKDMLYWYYITEDGCLCMGKSKMLPNGTDKLDFKLMLCVDNFLVSRVINNDLVYNIRYNEQNKSNGHIIESVVIDRKKYSCVKSFSLETVPQEVNVDDIVNRGRLRRLLKRF